MDRIVPSHIQIFEFNSLNFERQIGEKFHIFNTRIFFIFKRWIFFELFVFTFNFLKISLSCWGPCVFYKIIILGRKDLMLFQLMASVVYCYVHFSYSWILFAVARGKIFTLLETSRKPLSKMACIFNLEF